MLKSELLAAIQREIQRHDFDYFTEVLSDGGRIVVPSCPKCKVRTNTSRDFLDHLANDAMPALLDNLTASRASHPDQSGRGLEASDGSVSTPST
jgi:hypothetical protein